MKGARSTVDSRRVVGTRRLFPAMLVARHGDFNARRRRIRTAPRTRRDNSFLFFALFSSNGTVTLATITKKRRDVSLPPFALHPVRHPRRLDTLPQLTFSSTPVRLFQLLPGDVQVSCSPAIALARKHGSQRGKIINYYYFNCAAEERPTRL